MLSQFVPRWPRGGIVYDDDIQAYITRKFLSDNRVNAAPKESPFPLEIGNDYADCAHERGPFIAG